MTGRVVTIGEAIAVLRSRELGSIAHAPDLVIGTGGAEGNVAIGLARLGAPVTWLGRVGDDGLGQRVARELRAEGVDTVAIVDGTAPTALLLKETPAAGRTRISYYRAGSAGSRLAPADLSALALTPDDILHVTGITPALSATARDAVEHALDLADAAGAAVSFDVNHRSRLWPAVEASPVYRAIASRATIVFAGDDEARMLVPELAIDADADAAAHDLAAAIAALGPREVIIKRGAAGASALVDGTRHDVAAVEVSVVDTVGAGDAFVAGYLAERLAGRDVAGRLATAALVGALVCTHAGDWEGLPTRADLAAHGAGGDPVTR